MDWNLTAPRLIQTVAAGALTLALVSTGPVGAQTSSAGIRIAVFADHYVMAGRAYDDLNVLERKVATVVPKAIRLEACGARATRALLAAAHRFHRIPLQLRVLDAAEPACSSTVPVAIRAAMRNEQRPLGIDDAAVARYWRTLTP